MVSSKSGTGNFSEQNRELEWPNRELFAPISELKPRGLIEEFLRERLPRSRTPQRYCAARPSIWCWRDHSAWQVGEAGNSHAMREPPVDGHRKTKRRKESNQSRAIVAA